MSRARELAKRLNKPMVEKLLKSAGDLSPNWQETFTVYPPGAQQLVTLIDAALNEDRDPVMASHQERIEFVTHILRQYMPEIVSGTDEADTAISRHANEIVERWEQDVRNAQVATRMGIEEKS